MNCWMRCSAPEVRSDHDIVQAYWTAQQGERTLTAFWQTALHDGLVADSAFPAEGGHVAVAAAQSSRPPPSMPTGGLEINFRPDPTIWDGRFANNGWLQELPKPLTKLTWENAALISPLTANRLGLGQWRSG